MSHARIEEVSDSDSDPAEGDISDLDDFDEREILKVRPSQVQPPTLEPSSHLIDPTAIPVQRQGSVTGHDGAQFQTTQDDSKYKDFQCLYPVYFDKNRSRAQGRRVGKENAVENPLAREIVAACGRLRLETLFEPAKLHPKDWSNPGRVKIKLKGSNNSLVNNSELQDVPRITSLEHNLCGLDNVDEACNRTPSLHASSQTPQRKSYNRGLSNES
jgi:signal recognition particle subunit SRP19